MTGSDLYFRRIMAAIWIIDGWGWGKHRAEAGRAAVELSRWEGMSNSSALSHSTASL